ncbi:hypothetical protein KCU77_g5378, partial [Aureobasidium melanogenum]
MDGAPLSQLFENGSIPWTSSSMEIGSGYDARTQQIKRSPFEKLPQSSSAASGQQSTRVHLTYKCFRKVEDLETYMSNVTSASIGFAGIAAFKAAASTMSNATCNKTNMTIIIRCTITLVPDEHFGDDLQLTQEAEDCLNAWQYPFRQSNSDRFLEQYGQYCVTGYTRQASFFSTSTFKTNSSEKLNQFAGHLGADFEYSDIQANAATNHIQRMSQGFEETSSSHEVFVTGLNRTSIQKSFADPRDVLTAWNTFLEDYVAQPTVAHLQHYANLNVGNRVRRPDAPIPVSFLPIELVRKSVLLGIVARSSPMVGVREQQNAVNELRKELLDHDHGGKINENDLSNVRAKIEERITWIGPESLWSKRQKLVERVDALCAAGHYWPLNQWTNTKMQSEWKTGLTSEDVHPDIRHEVAETMHPFNVNWRPGTQTQSLIFDQPSRFIIGAKLCSYWPHGTGGWWRLTDGGLLQHKLTVGVETHESRGCDWKLYVYSVDNELYRREWRP